MITTASESKLPLAPVNPQSVLAEKVKAIAEREKHRLGHEKLVSDLLHQGGIAQRILEGERFELTVENEPHLPLTLSREQEHLVVTRHKQRNGQRYPDMEVRFELTEQGELRLSETVKYRRGKAALRGRYSAEALSFSQELIAQGYSEAIARTLPPTAAQQVYPEPASESAVQQDSEPQALELQERRATEPELTSEPQGPKHEAQPIEAAAVEQRSKSQKDREEEAHPPQMPLPEMSQPTPPTKISGPTTTEQTVTAEQVQAWLVMAQALSKPDDYLSRVEQVTACYHSGVPLSVQAEAALKQILTQYHQTLNQVKDWYRLSRDQGAPPNYLEKIKGIGEGLKTGQPLSEGAIAAMQKDFHRAAWIQFSEGVAESTPERQTARVALRALQQGKATDEILEILEFDPCYLDIYSQQGLEPAQTYRQGALDFALKVYHQATQQHLSQPEPEASDSRGLQ